MRRPRGAPWERSPTVSIRTGLVRRAVIAAAALACGGLAPALADQPAREATPVALMSLSGGVAAWGREARDPLALIVAAEIRSRVTVRPVDRRPDQSGEAGAEPAAADLTVEALLAEAVALAKGDPTVAALADDVKASATKGLVQGAGASRATVRSAGSDWYRRLKFEGARYAEAYVELAGPGTVSMSVFDDKGNLVCRDTNPSSVAYCGWTPSATTSFDLRVENRGAGPVPYRLFTN